MKKTRYVRRDTIVVVWDVGSSCYNYEVIVLLAAVTRFHRANTLTRPGLFAPGTALSEKATRGYRLCQLNRRFFCPLHIGKLDTHELDAEV